MSINRTREIIEKPGCGITVGVILIVVLALGFFLGGNSGGPQEEERQGLPVASIGEYQITDVAIDNSLAEIKRELDAQREQYRQYGLTPPPITPQSEASMRAEALNQQVLIGLFLDLAADKGIRVSDEQILQEQEKQLNTAVNEERLKFESNPQSKGKRFDDEFKKSQGITPTEDVKRRLEETEKLLERSAFRARMAAATSGPLLQQAYANAVKPRDEDVRKSQSTYVFKAILIQGGPDAKQKAEKVVDEIKKGLSFEQAIEKYSANPAPPKGKKSDQTQDLTMLSLLRSDVYEPLRDMKVGEVSEPLDIGMGHTIYKLIKIKEMSKADFDKNKQTYAKEYATAMADKQLREDLEKRRAQIKWQSEGYRLLYDAIVVMQDPKLGPDQKETKLKELLEEIQTYIKESDEDVGLDAAESARLQVLERLWPMLAAAEQKELRGLRIEVYQKIVEEHADLGSAMELIKMLLDEKDKVVAAALQDAAELNQDYDPINADYHKQTAALFAQAKKAGLVTPEEESKIQKELDRWTSENAEIEAERKRQEEEDRKAEAEAERRAKEEEAKKKAEEKKTGTPSTPTPLKTTG